MLVHLIEIKTTMVSLSWNIAGRTVVTEIRISYFNTDEMCFKDIGNVSLRPDQQNHNLHGLEEHTQYEIEITVLHEGRIIGRDSIIANTTADSKIF